ncbi:MAG: formylglycine-generating enzyme family protein [Magnetococcales bacterium]|nr:formylglycine-generating enzyme family protein [Magnetococcales bacterium]
MSHCPTCQMPVFKNEQICRRCGTDLEQVMPGWGGGGLWGGFKRVLFQGWRPTGAKTLIVSGAFLLAVGLSYWNHVTEEREREARLQAEQRLIAERAEADRRRAEERVIAEQKAAAEKAAVAKAAAEKADAEKSAMAKAAAEKSAMAKAAVEKADAEKTAMAKAAAEKADVEKRAAEAEKKAAAEKAVAEKKVLAKEGATASSWRDPLTGMSFVQVPAGQFEMGCGGWQDRCDADEKPIHPVRLNGFWMGQKEVTQGQWRAIMGHNPSRFAVCGDECPVEQVSWNDIQGFLAKLNQGGGQCRFRLPTEAEWEYACRSGGKPERYCGGDGSWSLGWVKRNSDGTTHPVGQKLANGLGLHDMSGNVWEWTADWYDPNGYAGAGSENPSGSQKGEKKVIRGGSWHYYADKQRSTARHALDPEFRHGNVGVRLVRQCP